MSAAARQVREALALAYDSHSGQDRKSGEPYITHPVEVTRILAELRMDYESLIAGLLHDTVEDTNLVTFEEIGVRFCAHPTGCRAMFPCTDPCTPARPITAIWYPAMAAYILDYTVVSSEGQRSAARKTCTPLSPAPVCFTVDPAPCVPAELVRSRCAAHRGGRDQVFEDWEPGWRQSHEWRHGPQGHRLAAAVSGDDGGSVGPFLEPVHLAQHLSPETMRFERRLWQLQVRIIIVKLADRLHNMRTLHSMPPHKQKKIARETLQVRLCLSTSCTCWTATLPHYPLAVQCFPVSIQVGSTLHTASVSIDYGLCPVASRLASLAALYRLIVQHEPG